ncbi:hypothetical protein EYF80_049265 [Liparis tanakae]|uniref:Uncharacterized protein n=1 Tax=Liparis tanakae TaxID=230148 RepID=A0A4Z2FH84_9TELE|nr:hypothetical protein EYF80_049265 [Liparis tanakae]
MDVTAAETCSPQSPFSMVERSGRVPSAHESGYCIIFSHRLTSSPTESISTSTFPVFTNEMKNNGVAQMLTRRSGVPLDALLEELVNIDLRARAERFDFWSLQ